ncbi:conserved hypothetical protein [Hyella patelloides LEGE 07179]|uniref:Uncharacterized protein n=1 Tax=Hyella patelloides LEGE 07179 TaxID=945734 RepID=A0A563W2H8_9CYAN|nr:hypothetical protein [Hyella patelloides]VEP17914.1 conserved hypothetical protein [Hyella patelloides LEGE 07179]
MVSAELLKTIQKLERQDKLYLMQVLISELANEESELIKDNLSYPIWSPYDAFEAADTMLEVLNQAKSQTDE